MKLFRRFIKISLLIAVFITISCEDQEIPSNRSGTSRMTPNDFYIDSSGSLIYDQFTTCKDSAGCTDFKFTWYIFLEKIDDKSRYEKVEFDYRKGEYNSKPCLDGFITPLFRRGRAHFKFDGFNDSIIYNHIIHFNTRLEFEGW